MQYIPLNIKKSGLVLTLATLAGLSQSAFAQSDQEIVDSMRTCQQIPEMSARLACYDRVLPPVNETATQVPRANPLPRAERESRPVEAAPAAPAAGAGMVRIVELEKPSLSRSILTAEDGRVYTATSNTVVPWPDPPFMIQTTTGAFGTVYLVLPGTNDRIRVSVD
ncbi:MAG: hypothetical protein CMP91_07830 [Gammaproteobacteria bacterium]|nr:hypothetical protein [Gammaproteobacteria bacterium]MAY03523.1 hypothetical protein [Gammaproteobacteria bacterium]|tara:strand:+ start:305908 stop:306405 length:498 start_codon:yes stop_codon:yes gene_type:complete